jgi:glutathione S-transferase
MNPAAGLIPGLGSSGRALVYQWVVFAVAELEALLFRWIRELGEGTTEFPARDRFMQAAAATESALEARDWLVDAQFSVADVMCASVLQGANSREMLRPWPGLEGYVQLSESRPAYAKAAAISNRPRT